MGFIDCRDRNVRRSDLAGNSSGHQPRYRFEILDLYYDGTRVTSMNDMTPAAILAEHMLGSNLSQRDIDRFVERGVPLLALVQNGIILKHRVVFDENGRFEFARHQESEDAVVAFVFPAFNIFGDVADLVAWLPQSGQATWLWRVGMVGEEQLMAPRFGPLPVHADMMDWLRAGRDGVAIVDAVQAAPLLRECGSLVVSTTEFGQRLRKLLLQPAPDILVDVEREQAA